MASQSFYTRDSFRLFAKVPKGGIAKEILFSSRLCLDLNWRKRKLVGGVCRRPKFNEGFYRFDQTNSRF